MSKTTKIEWCDYTFNAWRGCQKVAAGCTNCYAEAMSGRNPGTLGVWGSESQGGTRVVASESMWRQPVKWNREAGSATVIGRGRPRVFCGSLMDWAEDWEGPILDSRGDQLFHNGVISQAKTGRPTTWRTEFGAGVPVTMADVRQRLFQLIDATPHLDWILLTKRPENVGPMWPVRCRGSECSRCKGDGCDPDEWARHPMEMGPDPCRECAYRPNVWLLTSIANQEDADRNIPELLKCRDLVPVLGVSAEPLVGPVDLSRCRRDMKAMLSADSFEDRCRAVFGWGDSPEQIDLDWVIVGGESGPHARPCNVEWIRSIVQQCAAAGVPCFVKQLGARPEYFHDGGITGNEAMASLPVSDPKGGEPSEWPEDIRVRQYPNHAEE